MPCPILQRQRIKFFDPSDRYWAYDSEALILITQLRVFASSFEIFKLLHDVAKVNRVNASFGHGV